MKHSKRRQKTGEMLMDVVKYLITVGFIGSAVTDKFNFNSGIIVILSALIIYLIAFFTIPAEKEDN